MYQSALLWFPPTDEMLILIPFAWEKRFPKSKTNCSKAASKLGCYSVHYTVVKKLISWGRVRCLIHCVTWGGKKTKRVINYSQYVLSWDMPAYVCVCVCAHKKHISTRQTHSHTQTITHGVKWKTWWNIYTLTSGGSTNATVHNSSMSYVFRAEQREGRAAFALLLYLWCRVFGSVFTHSHCTAANSYPQTLNII